MEVKSVHAFTAYYERTRQVTNNFVAVIPPDKLNWAYMPGKFSLGDLVRHIAAIERHVFAEVVLGNKPTYTGCGEALASGYENTVAYFNEMHSQSMHIFNSLSDADMQRNIKSLDGKEVEIGNFLRALVLHEIHHRGAMSVYLNLLGVQTPTILGFNEKQVIALSQQ